MTDEIPFEEAVEEALPAAVPQPEVVQAQVEPPKRRGRPPKAKVEAVPESQPNPSQTPNKIIVLTRYPYSLHCSSQNVLIPAGVPTEVEPDYWIQSQIDAGLLKVVK